MGSGYANASSGAKGAKIARRVMPFGKYLLLDRIAVGGMAEVFIGKSFGVEGFEKILAIKRILPTMAEDSEFIDMFIDEAKIAGQLNHANIVPIFELGKIGDSHYIAMEYVRGKDMLQIMNRFRRLRRKMPPAMMAFIASKICEGLEYAHTKRDRHGHPLNLIHRDVSPQNILVDYDGQVRLIDFGIAKASSRTTKTQAGVLKGKFGYMSPEQVRGLPIDHRSDVFALGTGMYEMLTSERLFLGESDFTTLERVRNAAVEPPSAIVSSVPSDLDAIIMKALARDPDDRYQSAGELQTDLYTFLAKQRPAFSKAQLSQWMRTAFATEEAEERARLDYFSQVGRPGAAEATGRGDKPSHERHIVSHLPQGGDTALLPIEAIEGPTADDGLPVGLGSSAGEFVDEATVITASPFDLPAEAPLPDRDEATQVFFANEEFAAHVGTGETEIPKTRVGPDLDLGATMNEREGVGMSAPASPPRIPPPSLPPPAVSASALKSESFFPSTPSSGATEEPTVPLTLQHPMLSGDDDTQPAPIPQVAPSVIAESSPPLTRPLSSAPLSQPAPSAEAFGADPPTVPESAPAPHPGVAPVEIGWVDPSPARTRRLGLLLTLTATLLVAAIATILFFVFREKPGVIQVHVVPEVGARVEVNGETRGNTPLTLREIPIGEHLVEVHAAGYRTASRTVTIANGAHIVLEIAMAEVPGTTLAPRTDDPPAEANDPEDRAPPSQAETPPADPTPDEGPANTAQGNGQLAIITQPGGARVLIDGADSGLTTPLSPFAIAAGRHEIGLQLPGGEIQRVDIEVTAGETAHIARRLE